MADYRIVFAETVGALILEVRGAMAQGWEPIGGVVCDMLNQMQTRYLQAMVKP